MSHLIVLARCIVRQSQYIQWLLSWLFDEEKVICGETITLLFLVLTRLYNDHFMFQEKSEKSAVYPFQFQAEVCVCVCV